MTHAYWSEIDLGITDVDIGQSNNYDVVIVGAGIAGLSTAYWLEKKDTQLKILIVDKGFLGAGATGKNAGFLTCGSAEHFYKLQSQFGLAKALEIWQFSETNHQLLLTEIIQSDTATVDYEKTGSCTLAAGPDDLEKYKTLFETMSSEKINVKFIDKDSVIKKYSLPDCFGGIEYKKDAVVHPLKLLKKIKSKLKNTKFLFGVAISDYSLTDSGWKTVLQNRCITSEKIIFCVNGYANTLLPELQNIIKPQRGQVIMTESLPKFIQAPCYFTKYLCYFRQLPDGQLLVGGFRNKDFMNENTNADEISDKIQNALTDFVQNHFSNRFVNTKNIKIDYRWSGIMGFTPDGQMIIGKHPVKKNIYLMAGCSGHGMGLSFHAAKLLVENIYGQTLPNHLDIQRFKVELY